MPTKFGIAFTALILNQAGALVHIYTDGSVLISHSGVEMGQGLHTKMIQVCRISICIFSLRNITRKTELIFYLSEYDFKINFTKELLKNHNSFFFK